MVFKDEALGKVAHAHVAQGGAAGRVGHRVGTAEKKGVGGTADAGPHHRAMLEGVGRVPEGGGARTVVRLKHTGLVEADGLRGGGEGEVEHRTAAVKPGKARVNN